MRRPSGLLVPVVLALCLGMLPSACSSASLDLEQGSGVQTGLGQLAAGGGVRPLAELTETEWDTVRVYPGFPGDRVNRDLGRRVLDPRDRPFDVEGTLLVFLLDGEAVDLIWVAQPPALTSERPVWGRDVVARAEGPTRVRLLAPG